MQHCVGCCLPCSSRALSRPGPLQTLYSSWRCQIKTPGACSQLESRTCAWQDIPWQGFGKDGLLTIPCAGPSSHRRHLRAQCRPSPVPLRVTVHTQLSPVLPNVGGEQLRREERRCGCAGRGEEGRAVPSEVEGGHLS